MIELGRLNIRRRADMYALSTHIPFSFVLLQRGNFTGSDGYRVRASIFPFRLLACFHRPPSSTCLQQTPRTTHDGDVSAVLCPGPWISVSDCLTAIAQARRAFFDAADSVFFTVRAFSFCFYGMADRELSMF